nr:MAG TPA: hypothetical protein [Caudoviricetes sp.]
MIEIHGNDQPIEVATKLITATTKYVKNEDEE